VREGVSVSSCAIWEVLSGEQRFDESGEEKRGQGSRMTYQSIRCLSIWVSGCRSELAGMWTWSSIG
jgi:hypothetical protein